MNGPPTSRITDGYLCYHILSVSLGWQWIGFGRASPRLKFSFSSMIKASKGLIGRTYTQTRKIKKEEKVLIFILYTHFLSHNIHVIMIILV